MGLDWLAHGILAVTPKRVALLTLHSPFSDILHPGRANISKDELREKLSGMYKAGKEQVSVFGLRTQFGGGKTTGFALVYDSPEAMKKFEPHYRLVRVGLATKIEKASRQQREFVPRAVVLDDGNRRRPIPSCAGNKLLMMFSTNRQAAQEPTEDPPRNGEGQGCQAQEGEIDGWHCFPFGSSPPAISRFRLVEMAGLCALLYDNATLDSAKFETTPNLEFIIGSRGVTAGFWLHSIQYRMFAFEATKILFSLCWL